MSMPKSDFISFKIHIYSNQFKNIIWKINNYKLFYIHSIKKEFNIINKYNNNQIMCNDMLLAINNFYLRGNSEANTMKYIKICILFIILVSHVNIILELEFIRFIKYN